MEASRDVNKNNKRSISRPFHRSNTLIAVFIVFALTLSGLALMASSNDSSALAGSGTVADPFKISSQSDLVQLNSAPYIGSAGSGKYFVLTGDIDLIGTWTPIGDYGSNNTAFWGTLNGQGHSITNLTVDTSQRSAGLFGNLHNATITDLNVTVGAGGIKTDFHVGADPTTATSAQYVGGLFGYSEGLTVNNTNIEIQGVVEIKRGGWVGGLGGYALNFTSSDVSVSTTGAGQIHNSNINGAYVSIEGGAVASTVSFLGGLIGERVGNGSIQYTFTHVNIRADAGKSVIGGFIGGTTGVGGAVYGTIKLSSSTGDILLTGDSKAGGFIGQISPPATGTSTFTNPTIEQSYSSSNIQSNAQFEQYIGGFVGQLNANLTISNSYALGNLDVSKTTSGNSDFVGGFAGRVESTNGKIVNSYYSGSIYYHPNTTQTLNSGTTPVTTSNYARGFSSVSNTTQVDGTNYYLTQTTAAYNVNGNGNGNGRTAVQLSNSGNFPGWDFTPDTGIWEIEGGHPVLQGFETTASVTQSPAGHGTVKVSLDGGPYNAGSNVTVDSGTVVSFSIESDDEDYVFLHWIDNNGRRVYGDAITFTARHGHYGITAVLALKEDAALLTLSSLPNDAATIKFTTDGDTFTYSAPVYLLNSSVVSITPTAVSPYIFSTWSDGTSTENITGRAIVEDTSLTVVYYDPATGKTFTLEASPSDGGTFTYQVRVPGSPAWSAVFNGTVSSVLFPASTDIRVTSVPNHGYIFSSWSNAAAGSTNPITVTLDANKILIGNFVRGSIIAAVAVPAGSGTFQFSTDGITFQTAENNEIVVPDGSTAYISASASSGYQFSIWIGKGNSSTISVVASGDETYSAYFAPITGSYTVATSASGGGRVLVDVDDNGATPVSGNVVVEAGKKVVITAEATTGIFQTFIGTETIQDTTITIDSIDKDYTEVAYFTDNSLLTYELEVESHGSGTATIKVAGWSEAVELDSVAVQIGTAATVAAVDGLGVFQYMIVDGAQVLTDSHTIPDTRATNCKVDVYFTDTSDVYTLNLYVAGSGYVLFSVDGGSTTLRYNGDIESPYVLSVDYGTDTVISYDTDNSYFQYFIYNVNQGTIYDTSITVNENSGYSSIGAIFTDNTTDVYEVDVSVVGNGSIIYKLGNDPLAYYGGSSVREIYVDDSESVWISYLDSSDGYFQFFVYTPDGGSETIQYDDFTLFSHSGVHEVVAHFTDNKLNTYTIELSTSGTGSITYELENAPTGYYSGSIALIIHVNQGEEVQIGHSDVVATDGFFQYFLDTPPGGPQAVVNDDTIIIPDDTTGTHAIQACFTLSRDNTHEIELSTEGSGYITFKVGGDAEGRFQSSSGTQTFILTVDDGAIVIISEEEDVGVFQYFIHGAEVVYDTQFQLGTAGDHTVQAYFTETDDTYELELYTAGSGFIIFTIGSNAPVRYHGDASIFISVDVGTITHVEMETDNSHFQYFAVDDVNITDDNYTVNDDTGRSIGAIFTDDDVHYYLVNVSVVGAGIITYTLGSDNVTEYSGTSSLPVYVDNLEATTIGYIENGGIFQYITVEKLGGDIIVDISGNYTIPSVSESASSETYNVVAYFTEDDTNIHTIELSTSGSGEIGFKVGPRPEAMYYGVDVFELSVDNGTTVIIDNHPFEDEDFQYFVFDGADLSSTETQLTISDDSHHIIVANFSDEDRTYHFKIHIIGDGIVSYRQSAAGSYTQIVNGETVEVQTRAPLYIRATDGGGHFQFFVIGGVLDVRNSISVPANTFGVDDALDVEAYFTEGSNVYTVSLAVYGGGHITYAVENRPTGSSSDYSPLILYVDVGRSTTIGHSIESGDQGEFTYFIKDSVVNFEDEITLTDYNNHSIIARFTINTNLYYLNVGTVGSGDISVNLGDGVGYFHGSKTISVDLSSPAAIGYRENGGYFQFFVYAVNGGSETTLFQNTMNINPVSGSTYQVTAHFTLDQSDVYTLRLSTSGNGNITFKVGSNPLGTYSSQTPRNLIVDAGDEAEIGHTNPGAYFQYFVYTYLNVSAAAVIDDDTITFLEDTTGTHIIVAHFTTATANTYQLDLSAIGNGSITYQLGTDPVLKIHSDGIKTIHVDNGNTIRIGQVPDAAPDVVGYFQYFDINGNLSDLTQLSLTISSAGYVKAHFTETGSVYDLTLVTNGSGNLTYQLYGSPAGSYYGMGHTLTVDSGTDVIIGETENSGTFMYYIYDGNIDYGNTITVTEAETSSHTVIGRFTMSDQVIEIEIGTVGAGDIAFKVGADPWGYYRSGTPGDNRMISVDIGTQVTIGHRQTAINDGYFQFFVYTPNGGSAVSVFNDTFSIPGFSVAVSYGDTYAAIAHFTENKSDSYSVDISRVGTGTVIFQVGTYPSGSYSGTTPHKLYVDSGVPTTFSHSAAGTDGYFQYFVKDDTVIDDDTIVLPGTTAGNHTLIAHFTVDKTGIYDLALSTEGNGYITYKVGSDPTGRFQSGGVSPTKVLYVDNGVSTLIGQDTDDQSYFQFFLYDSTTVDRSQTRSIPSNTAGSHTVAAYFTLNTVDTYSVELSTVGNGFITYAINGGAVGEFRSSAPTPTYVLHVDNGYNLTVGYRAGVTEGYFQYFVSDDIVEAVSDLDFNIGDHTVAAHFTAGRTGTYSVTFSTVGSGYITFKVGTDPAGEFKSDAIVPTYTLHLNTSSDVSVGEIEDTGHFQYFVYNNSNVDSNTIRNITGVGRAGTDLYISAHFSAGPGEHAITLSTEGSGYITFKIGADPTGSFRSSSGTPDHILYVDDGTTVQIGRTEDQGYFQVYVYDGAVDLRSNIPVGDNNDHTIVARFTQDHSGYAIWLSTVGSGYITFSLPGLPTTSYNGTLPFVLNVDNGVSVPIGETEDQGYFQFFMNDLLVNWNTSLTVTPTVINIHTVTAHFTDDRSVSHRLALSPDGTGRVDISFSGVTPFEINGEVWVDDNAEVHIYAVVTDASSPFKHWIGDATGENTDFILTVTDDYVSIAVFATPLPPPPTPSTDPTITASATIGVTITPVGSIAVIPGNSVTFTYIALPGYIITNVAVDEKQVDFEPHSGSYTFYDVTSNHTISVTADAAPVYVLSITITGGEGYAEYHFNTEPYTRYTKSVEIQGGSDVYANIVPLDGYEFIRWTQSIISTDKEVFFEDVHSNITLTAELRSSDSGGGDLINSWWVVIAAALLLLLALFVLFLVLRRRYDLIKVSSENVIISGKGKIARKRVYKFTVEGTFTGLRYRVGDVGEDEEPVWKQPVKTDDGYEIPREDVTDNITLEAY